MVSAQEQDIGSFVRQYVDSMIHVRRMSGGTTREGYTYLCMEDYVQDQGVAFASASLTDDEAAIVLGAVAIARTRGCEFVLKECYYNAQCRVLSDPTKTLRYCEGYASGTAHFPVLHGWASINGKVVDYTWRGHAERARFGVDAVEAPFPHGDRIYGAFPADWHYYGVELPTERIDSRFGGPLIDDWEAGWPVLTTPRKRG